MEQTKQNKIFVRKIKKDNSSMNLNLPNWIVRNLNYNLDDVVTITINNDQSLTVRKIDLQM
jgi:antitoxin component of MazEF toxin-antitoxin module